MQLRNDLYPVDPEHLAELHHRRLAQLQEASQAGRRYQAAYPPAAGRSPLISPAFFITIGLAVLLVEVAGVAALAVAWLM